MTRDEKDRRIVAGAGLWVAGLMEVFPTSSSSLAKREKACAALTRIANRIVREERRKRGVK